MVQASDAFGAWDGWVLYTSEDGHKYHWNHLTHESRWAVEQHAEDRHAEECFQAYIRQRTSTTNPDKHRADRLDTVEAGDGDDDDYAANKELRGFVTPSAGVGPIAMSVAAPDRANRSGIAGRVSDALRKAVASVERPRQDAVGDTSANELDPELGQERRSKRQTSRCYHGHKGEASGTVSGGSSRSSSSESGNSSGSDGAGNSSSSRSGGITNIRLHPRGDDHQDATLWKSGRDQTDSCFSKNGGSPFKDSRSPATGQGFHEGARRSHRSRRHDRRRKAKAGTRECEPLHKHRAVIPMTAEVLAGLGRQAVENAVRTTVRAVLGGWKGMTTAALRAVQKWQINGNLGGAVLPIAIIPSTPSKESCPKTTTCHLQDDDVKTDSAQVRPFLPNASGPPQHFRSSNLFGIGTARPAPERSGIPEGFREEEGEAGRWVGGDGGLEEQNGGFTSPPKSRR